RNAPLSSWRLGVLALICVFASPSFADAPASPPSASQGEVEQRAKDLYDAGSEAYRAGRYLVAIEAFREARALATRPTLTFSLAQAYRLQYFVDGDAKALEQAIAMYRA